MKFKIGRNYHFEQIKQELFKNFDVNIKEGMLGNDIVRFYDSKEGMIIFKELFLSLNKLKETKK